MKQPIAYNFFVWPNFALNFQTFWSEKISNLHKLNAFSNVEDHFEAFLYLASSYKKYMFLKIRLTQGTFYWNRHTVFIG